MNKKYRISVLMLLIVLLGLTTPVFAQDDAYSIHLRRDFGYGGGVNIRGTFTISLVGDETLVKSVRFWVDEEVMAQLDSVPFRFQFHTDDYGVGSHTLWAEVHLLDGTTLTTSAIQYNFVSPEAEREQVSGILGGILGAIVVTLLIVGLVQGVLFKGKRNEPHQPGTSRHYGMMGGTICPKCGRPFARHLYGVNLVVGRLDRCDNCGKWVMTIRATPKALQAAEEAENSAYAADAETPTPEPCSEKALDDTRFIDGI